MTTTGLMEQHECELKVTSSIGVVARSGRGVVKLKLEILSGPHRGRPLFYYYAPQASSYARELATFLGLAASKDTIDQNVGKHFIGRVTKTKHNDNEYNHVDLTRNVS